MTILQAVFLGIIQGLTEFLPVSSSGHLAILENIFHINTGEGSLFDIMLHIATLSVALIVFREDIIELFKAFCGMAGDLFANAKIKKQNRSLEEPLPLRCIVKNNYRKFLLLLIVSTIPTGIIGVAGRKLIHDASDTLIVPGICLLATAALLMFSDKIETAGKIPRDTTYREALIIGIAQGFATLPGLSRSGATIAACLICGFDRRYAVKYSFIMSIPAIAGAAIIELADVLGQGEIDSNMLICSAAGMIAAGVVGWICIKTMLAVVKNRKFRYFAWYCLAAGVFAIAGQFIWM